MFIRSVRMSEGVRCQERSSLFQKVVEFSVFLACPVSIHRVGWFSQSSVYFWDFLQGELFTLTELGFLLSGFVPKINGKVTRVPFRTESWECRLPFGLSRHPNCFVWCIGFWAHIGTAGRGGCCSWEARSLCRADRPFFFPKRLKLEVTAPCLIN